MMTTICVYSFNRLEIQPRAGGSDVRLLRLLETLKRGGFSARLVLLDDRRFLGADDAQNSLANGSGEACIVQDASKR